MTYSAETVCLTNGYEEKLKRFEMKTIKRIYSIDKEKGKGSVMTTEID